MDLEQYVYEELLDCDKYTDKMKRVMTNLYMKAYHDGRHEERSRLVKEGYLIIDPNRIDELNRQAFNPCEGCTQRADYLKIGCKANPKECEQKQKQLRALEILSYFK